jgi:signal transduction histidine kinase
MNRLVEQLLRVSRLDAVPLDVSARLDLRAVATSVSEYLLPWAISRKRSLALEVPEDPVWVLGNADALADALRNLIENAVHHTPPETEVLVKVAVDGAVAVQDCGPGVSPDDRKRIFERFARSGTGRGPGAGLGLAIVMEIAKAHNGSVEVTDAPDGGARFTLKLRAY